MHILRSERLGTLWLGVAIFTCLAVESWRLSHPWEATPLHVTDLLSALNGMPGPVEGGNDAFEKAQWPSVSGPIAVHALDSTGWVAAGLTPRRAASAVRYAAAIGGIQSMADLRRMRVLPPGWLDHFEGQLRFPPPPEIPEPAGDQAADHPLKQRHAGALASADLNRADSLEIIAVKGAGPWVAGRILRYRRRYGGFATSDQLTEAFGGWDSLAQALQPVFHCKVEDVVKRCADTLTAEHWRALPGVGHRQSKVLERLVRHHGGAEEVLLSSPVLDSAQWRLVLCYIEPCAEDGAAE